MLEIFGTERNKERGRQTSKATRIPLPILLDVLPFRHLVLRDLMLQLWCDWGRIVSAEDTPYKSERLSYSG
jgi:hypothetical protein